MDGEPSGKIRAARLSGSGFHEGLNAAPDDFAADAKQNERDHAEDALSHRGREFLGDPVGVRIAEVDDDADQNGADEQAEICEH